MGFFFETDFYCIHLHSAALWNLDNGCYTNDLFINLAWVKKLIIKMQYASLLIISMLGPH